MNGSTFQNPRGGICRGGPRLGHAAATVSLLLVAFCAIAQTHNDPYDLSGFAKPDATANPAAGAGVMIAGELWDSFLPQSVRPYYSEAATVLTGEFIRIGNFDRAWSSPTSMWPGGWNYGNYWAQGMTVCEWNPDPNFNPATIGGVANPAYSATSGPNYALASLKNATSTVPGQVPGFDDPTRKYQRETKWVDPITRHHAIYEAGWPTNIGVDVKLEIHQYTLNWNNFNDFIILKLTLKNTGVKDINADGTPESTNNVIHALTLGVHAELFMSYNLNRGAARSSRLGATRALGYIGDNDPSGSPWDMVVVFPGESVAGKKDMGLNDWPLKFYTEVWSGWSWIGAFDSTGATKNTIFGTHPIGVGPQRGWYTSAGQQRGFSGFYGYANNNPKQTHTLCMGTFYANGGKSRNATQLDLSPNPNFFASGTTGNPESFVPSANPTRPNGDRKLFSEESPAAAFETSLGAKTYEPGWIKGFSSAGNFDGDLYSGVGPFRLNVGESVSVYFAEVGGYRLQGIANAMAAARWTLAHNMTPPDAYPAVPVMRIDNTTQKSVLVRWDNKSETVGGNFAGYKIYKAALSRQIDWLQTGMRVLDRYMENTTVGPTPDNLKRAINPNFDVDGSGANGKLGVADSWGPYELVAVIPAAQLAQYANTSVAGFNYAYEDKQVGLGFKYWFYVAAYTNTPVTLDNYVSFEGSNSATTNSIETSNVNRNGASGLWVDTYPFADLNAFYPKTAEGLRAIGAGFIVKAALADPSQLVSGKTKIGVYPNPYKKKAFFDSAIDPFDHKVAFYNLPQRVKITILDVAGQVIDVIYFESNDPNGGSTFWDCFSKNGIEVASGLYIFVAEYNGGQQTGYFSILR